jgi:hypothetical protein
MMNEGGGGPDLRSRRRPDASQRCSVSFLGAQTIDSTGNIVGSNTTSYTDPSCGTYNATGTGGFFGREMRFSSNLHISHLLQHEHHDGSNEIESDRLTTLNGDWAEVQDRA